MVTTALLVRLGARPGKEVEVQRFLEGALPIVEGKPATIAWSRSGWVLDLRGV